MMLPELIRTRRSISTFLDKPIPNGLIEGLLETAVWAPNHHLTEPWRFILLTGDAPKRYADYREIDPEAWKGREQEGILYVPHAGEMLFRARGI